METWYSSVEIKIKQDTYTTTNSLSLEPASEIDIWADAPFWANWVARDKSGCCSWFQREPVLNALGNHWWSGMKGFVYPRRVGCDIPISACPALGKVKRPDGERNDIPDWAKYKATDANGDIWLYAVEPICHLTGGYWTVPDSRKIFAGGLAIISASGLRR